MQLSKCLRTSRSNRLLRSEKGLGTRHDPLVRLVYTSLDIGRSFLLLKKEVIQPHLPIRLPCYDFTPVIDLTLGGCLLAVSSPTLGTPDSHGVTGGVYKTRERIHPDMLIRDY